MNYQMSGEVSEASAQEIGQKLGAQAVVSGSLINMGTSYRFRTKVINVSRASIETSFSISIKSDPQIEYLLAQGRRAPQSAVSTPSASSGQGRIADSAEQELRAYKIGDTGPAGGLIFYDKGNNSGGWRYLEAAPVEAEFLAVWSVRGTQVENTQELIGSGRRNTQLIVETFRITQGEWDTAAQKANDLVFKGFSDWFLPSRAELDQMYGNLKRKNLGDFKSDWYWSSTERSSWNTYSYDQSFKDGKMDYHSKTDRCYVRPIRQVPGPNTARSSANSSDSDGYEKPFFEVGYNYVYDIPLGFSLGLSTGPLFCYTAWNIYVPKWGDHQKDNDLTYNSDNKINGSGFSDKKNITTEGFEWSVGGAIDLYGKDGEHTVFMPIGIGGRHKKEWRSFDKKDDNGILENTKWHGPSDWDSKLVLEAGIRLNTFRIYLSGTYRSYDFFKEHGFSVGAGIRI
jgi:hypothetical protein